MNEDVTRDTVKSPLDGKTLNEMLERLGGQAWGLVYMTYEVFFCHEKAGRLSDKINHAAALGNRLMECRFFSDIGEYHVWKYNDEYKRRLLLAGACERTYKSTVALWGDHYEKNPDGTLKKDEDGFYKQIANGRGCHYGFPPGFSCENDEDALLPLKLKLVSYYDFTDDGLVKFTDLRVAEIVGKNGGTL